MHGQKHVLCHGKLGIRDKLSNPKLLVTATFLSGGGRWTLSRDATGSQRICHNRKSTAYRARSAGPRFPYPRILRRDMGEEGLATILKHLRSPNGHSRN